MLRTLSLFLLAGLLLVASPALAQVPAPAAGEPPATGTQTLPPPDSGTPGAGELDILSATDVYINELQDEISAGHAFAMCLVRNLAEQPGCLQSVALEYRSTRTAQKADLLVIVLKRLVAAAAPPASNDKLGAGDHIEAPCARSFFCWDKPVQVEVTHRHVWKGKPRRRH